MPWEDIMVGAMLRDVGRVHHHPGWKAAWQDCDKGAVLKHLDNDAPALVVSRAGWVGWGVGGDSNEMELRQGDHEVQIL